LALEDAARAYSRGSRIEDREVNKESDEKRGERVMVK